MVESGAGKSNSGKGAVDMEVTICNEQGLHARPAAQFVRIASKYPDVDLTVSKDGMAVNGKSIIGIMMLAAGRGTKLRLSANGAGADDLLRDLESLVDSGFGEMEAE